LSAVSGSRVSGKLGGLGALGSGRPGRGGQQAGPVGHAGHPSGVDATVEATVTGLGYDLVAIERAPRGLLRVTLDRVPGQTYPSGDGEFITVDDCEQVTRQLQYVLEVAGVDYARLEVSSPGLDRPLRREADFRRFAGQAVDVTLKQPFQGRKAWRGVLAEAPAEAGAPAGFSLHVVDGKTEQLLGFTLDEVREARLVPVVDFKGRGARGTGAPPAAEAVPGVPGAPGTDGDQNR
jgi:ribosome maturation factor RimP